MRFSVYLLAALGRASKPINVLLMALTYFLGAGIARFLGSRGSAQAFWLGLAGVLLAQITLGLLSEVFQAAEAPAPPLQDDRGGRRLALREPALYLSTAALAAAALISFILYKAGSLTSAALLAVAASLVVIVAYAVPPLRLMGKGFGELLLAIHIAYLGPSIGFLLQAGTFHLLLNVSILPLTLLLLATFLVLDFPSYAEDLKYGRATLLIRLGWENALRLHQALLISAYVLLGVSALLGFSLALLAPGFLTIPFALLQWNFLRNIARGAKPIWGLLTANAVALFGLTAYFLALSFWLR
jgi:1,4-dihydroxy-2-naphthoate octaprenyltransferase